MAATRLKRTLAAAGIAFGLAGPATAAPVELWAQFSIGPIGTYADISIPLTGGTFGVGGVGGPSAGAALLSQVLATLTEVRIGGIGNAVQVGVATQGFGPGLTNVQFGSGPGETFADFANHPFGFGSFGPGVSDLGWSSAGGNPGGSVFVFSFETTPGTLIGFVLSSAFTGDQSARAGESLTFRWAALGGSFGLQPNYLEDGGRVILFGDDGLTAVPGPGSLALFGVGLLGLVMRRRPAAR